MKKKTLTSKKSNGKPLGIKTTVIVTFKTNLTAGSGKEQKPILRFIKTERFPLKELQNIIASKSFPLPAGKGMICKSEVLEELKIASIRVHAPTTGIVPAQVRPLFLKEKFKEGKIQYWETH